MPWAGDAVEAQLRVLRVRMDALGETLEQALASVPDDLRDAVHQRWQEEHDQPIQPVRVLSGTGGPRPWSTDWHPEEGYHWRRLRQYTLDRLGRSEVEVDSLDDLSNRVLAHLEDPRPSGPASFRVRGLVIGYVQSGKTANITALIAKAADLGYRFFVVLSGMDDGLRKQTQDRLARELGLAADEAGVGLPEAGQRWITVTTGELRGGDFNPGAIGNAVLQGNERVIGVVKKNAHVLRRLVGWIQGAPAGLPVLVIDDEADQASVNTGGNRSGGDGGGNGDDQDPSRINELVRDLLARFERTSYVAYTATPFANVFIDPVAQDRMVQEDLYPKDFIISLPRPPHYVGAERLFGRGPLEHEDEDVEPIDVIRPISDADVTVLMPPPGGGGTFMPQMCPSLRTALRHFVLASAAKMEREGRGDSRSTMLIHTSHRTRLHNHLVELVRDEQARLRQAWHYDRDSIRPTLKAEWDTDFRVVTASIDSSLERSFEQIEPSINVFLRNPPDVRVLNITSRDELDYSSNPVMKVIVIGGNRLSRGLTLEDLMVSYYIRASPNYDTLLQMGRWCGYRGRYVDLTRLWTTALLAGRFRDLALVEEELREEIAVYERARITPMEFGPKIRTHPAMAITAANKMGVARRVDVSFQGELRQTTRFQLWDREWLEVNLAATRAFVSQLGPPDDGDPVRPGWINVPWQQVTKFLGSYQTVEDVASFHAPTVAAYIQRQAGLGELVRWRVSIRARPEGEEELGSEDLGVTGWGEVNTISRSRLRDDRGSVGVITNPARSEGQRHQGDEEVGLTDEQIDRAREQCRSGVLKIGTALRAERDVEEGLLLIYPVSRHSVPAKSARNRVPLFDSPNSFCTLVGLAVAFPPSKSAATVEYMTNPIGQGLEDQDDPD